MNTRTRIRQELSRPWVRLTFQYGIAGMACALAIWMHYQYRLQGSWIFLTLPIVGTILLSWNMVAITSLFTTSLPKWDPIRTLLKRLELFSAVLVRIFVYSSLLWFANGILDNRPPVYRSALIDSEAWTTARGLPSPYSWVTLQYRDDPGHPKKVLITAEERQQLWGAQPVSITLQQGFFGVPTVTTIEQDWGWYGNEILKHAPTATVVMQRKLYFDLTHDRWEEGIEAAKRYLEINPSDWETAILTGELLFRAFRYHDSLFFYKHGVEQRPSYANMQEYATALNWTGQSLHAAEILKSSIPLAPQHWEAYYHLGYVYGDMGHYEEAIMYFEESLKRRPGSLEIKMMIAKHRQDIATRNKFKPTKTNDTSSLGHK